MQKDQQVELEKFVATSENSDVATEVSKKSVIVSGMYTNNLIKTNINKYVSNMTVHCVADYRLIYNYNYKLIK